MPNLNRFSGPITIFHERSLPERATPAGYAALIDAFLGTPRGLSVPLPRQLSAIGRRHRAVDTPVWRLYSPRYEPQPTLEGHLTFALKYEGLDLAVLKRLFLAVGPADVEAIVRARPTGSYARRIWFLYEWLTGQKLDLPSADMGTYVLALDPAQQLGTEGENSPRHRVKNNLPGTPRLLPARFSDAGDRAIHGLESGRACTRDREPHAARSYGPNGSLPAPQGFQNPATSSKAKGRRRIAFSAGDGRSARQGARRSPWTSCCGSSAS